MDNTPEEEQTYIGLDRALMPDMACIVEMHVHPDRRVIDALRNDPRSHGKDLSLGIKLDGREIARMTLKGVKPTTES